MALSPTDKQNDTDRKAEREAARQDVFMREVDDAMREEAMMGFFKRYGYPLLAAIVIGLAAFGGYLWWEADKAESEQERAERFVMALDRVDGNHLKDADATFATLAEEGRGGGAIAADLMRAGIALEQGRKDDAVKIYARISADTKAPQPYRDLATVREVSANFDTMEPQAVIDRLSPLAAPGNAWFGVAGEMVGIAYLKQGKEEQAGPLFAKIARDEDLPESIRGRVRQLASLLGYDSIDDVVNDDADDAAKSADADEKDDAKATDAKAS